MVEAGGGVGYEVHVPLSTYYEIEKAGAGAVVRLHIHTHVREDDLALYGFWSAGERRLFQKLIAVSGIGPRLAQVILSGMSAEDLLAALAGGDVARLTTIPGVGKKTAERLVLELKERARELAMELAAEAGGASPLGPAAVAAEDDVVGALVNLGYKQAQAERAAADTRRAAPADAAFHELLRAALQRMGRG